MRALSLALLTAGLVSALGLGGCGDSSPNVIFQTSAGQIEIEVYPKKAPLSAADFLYHVDEGLYDNQGFYRTVTAQTDPLKMGMSIVQGGRLDLVPVTASIDHEPTGSSGLSNIRGSVSIARDAVDTGSAAYFFVNLDDNLFLDEGGERTSDRAGFAVFGSVISGLDVLEVIQAGKVQEQGVVPGAENQFLQAPVMIERAYRK